MAASGFHHVCLSLSHWLWAPPCSVNNIIISCRTAIGTQQTWERNKWFTPQSASYALMEEDGLPSGVVCWKAKLQMHLKPAAKWESLSVQRCKAFCYMLVFLCRPIKPCIIWAHERYWDLHMRKHDSIRRHSLHAFRLIQDSWVSFPFFLPCTSWTQNPCFRW